MKTHSRNLDWFWLFPWLVVMSVAGFIGGVTGLILGGLAGLPLDMLLLGIAPDYTSFIGTNVGGWIGLGIGAATGGAVAGIMLWVILHRKFQAGSIWAMASIVGGSMIAAVSVAVIPILVCFASMVGALSVAGWVMILGGAGVVVGLALVVIPMSVLARRIE